MPLYHPQLHTSDLLVTYPAIFADEYIVLHTWQFMWPFASVCRYCRVHIYGSSIQLRGPLYSHISIYLNFEVYMEFITIYGNVFRYIQRALLLMSLLLSPLFYYLLLPLLSSPSLSLSSYIHIFNLIIPYLRHYMHLSTYGPQDPIALPSSAL